MTKRPHGGAVERLKQRTLLLFFSFFFSGKHQWGQWICMSGRLCQWAHWEGWASGWSRGKQPSKCTVNNQSIRGYYRHTNFTPISPKSPSNRCFQPFFILCVCVRARVCARAEDQVDSQLQIASIGYIASFFFLQCG